MEGLISHAEEASYYAMKNVLPTYSKGKMEVKNILENTSAFLSKEQNVKQHKEEKDQVLLKGVPMFKMPKAQDRGSSGMGLVKKVKGRS